MPSPAGGLAVTTQQLEYLVAIARASTWGEAAAAVGVTPSALSQGIAELERRLGVSLFERDGRRRVPSRDHPEVLAYAEQVVAATSDLARWLDHRRGGRTGAVRLGLIDAAATHHFRDVLRDYRTARPDVELRMTVAPSASLLGELVRAELDLVVCVQPDVVPASVQVTPVLDDPLSVLAPPGVEPGAPSTWGPWVTFPSGSHTRALVAEALHRAGVAFDVVAESHQPEVLREMALLGIGWTVLPLAGLGSTRGLQVVQEGIAVRRLVVARRAGRAPDQATTELAAALGA